MTGQETNKRGLRALIREADKYGWLKRADFDESGLWMHPLDAPVSMRNDLAHGSDRLLPAGSHEMISFCAEIINHLFPLMAQNEPAPEACP